MLLLPSLPNCCMLDLPFRKSSNGLLVKMSMVEIRVPNLDCEGCASKLKKALSKVKGVEEVEVEMEAQKIIVRGYDLDERKVLKAIKRAGKVAEPWPFPPQRSHYMSSFYKYPNYVTDHYYQDNSPAPAVAAFFQTPAAYSLVVSGSDEAVASIFSDDNAHACSIM